MCFGHFEISAFEITRAKSMYVKMAAEHNILYSLYSDGCNSAVIKDHTKGIRRFSGIIPGTHLPLFFTGVYLCRTFLEIKIW